MARYLVFPSARSTRLITGEREPSTDAYLPCTMRNDSLAADSLSCEVTETRKLGPPSEAGAVCVGLVAATRVGGSDSDACGASDIGALALALADAGLRAGGAAGAAAAGAATLRVGGFGGGALAPAGMPPLSAASPLTASVLILRGSL